MLPERVFSSDQEEASLQDQGVSRQLPSKHLIQSHPTTGLNETCPFELGYQQQVTKEWSGDRSFQSKPQKPYNKPDNRATTIGTRSERSIQDDCASDDGRLGKRLPQRTETQTSRNTRKFSL